MNATQQRDGSYLIFCEDISEEKLAQRKQDEMQQLVFKSSQMASLGELAATVAHEINTPLAVVRSASEFARKEMAANTPDPEYITHKLKNVAIGTKKIETIVGSLLSISRRNEPSKEIVDLRIFIEETLTFMTLLLSKHQVRTNINLGDVPLKVNVRTGEINQILTNLVTNARDAMENRGNKIIRIQCQQQGNNVLLSVHDSGCGIPAHLAPRIFEKFFSTKNSGHGTGLGLPLSKKLAEENGGTLTFTTCPGMGTTFTLTLPLAEALNSEVSATKESPEPPLSEQETAMSVKQKRVLLVDDEPAILEILQEYISSEGYHTTCASTLAEARDKIATQNFDFVFTDYVLDYGTGEDVLHECRKRFAKEECRVFLLTGYAKDNKIDVDGHLRKPFHLDEVREALRSF